MYPTIPYVLIGGDKNMKWYKQTYHLRNHPTLGNVRYGIPRIAHYISTCEIQPIKDYVNVEQWCEKMIVQAKICYNPHSQDTYDQWFDYLEDHKVDVSHPVIIIKHKNELLLVDGNHRLYFAHRQGIKHLDAYVIDRDDLRKRVNPLWEKE